MKSFDKQKLGARFDEAMKYAPAVCANYAIIGKLISDKINGFTNQDVQNLVAIQSRLVPNAERFSAMGQIAKVASELNAEEKQAFDVGTKFANVYVGILKTAASVPGGWRQALGNALAASAGSLAIAGGLGGVAYASSKLKEKEMAKKIQNSFNHAMSMGDEDSALKQDPTKARKAFETLVHFAPHIAAEPNAAYSFMTKIVTYDGGVHASDLKDISEVERNLRQARPSGSMDMITGIMGAADVGKTVSRSWSDVVKPQQSEFLGRAKNYQAHKAGT